MYQSKRITDELAATLQRERQDAFPSEEKDVLHSAKLSPLHATDLMASSENIPPALVVTGEYDVLRDDGILYKNLLNTINVTVIHRHFPAMHGALSFANQEVYPPGDDMIRGILETIEAKKLL